MFRLTNPFDFWQCTGEDIGGFLHRDVTAGEHEGLNTSGVQCGSFQLPVADASVSSQDNPALLAGMLQPVLIWCAANKFFGESFDIGASVPQRFNNHEVI